MTTKGIQIEVPYFKDLSRLINKHLEIINVDIPPTGIPTSNDEAELLITLMGLSRLIEYNMRVAFEKLNDQYKLKLKEPNTFEDLLKGLEPRVKEKEKIELMHHVRVISNGLVHSDFRKVYLKTKSSYDIKDLNFYYDKFDPPVIRFASTITKYGLNINIEGDKVTAEDNKGNPIPAKALIPDGTNDIDIDFKNYYLCGAFIFTYDVLYNAYSDSIIFKEDMKKVISKKK